MRNAKKKKKNVQCTCSLTVNKNETLCHCYQNVKKIKREEIYSYQVIVFLVVKIYKPNKSSAFLTPATTCQIFEKSRLRHKTSRVFSFDIYGVCFRDSTSNPTYKSIHGIYFRIYPKVSSTCLFVNKELLLIEL